MIGDKVGDFRIIHCTVVGGTKFAVGENLNNALTPYCSWMANKDTPHDYYWGHYCATKDRAMKDCEKRVNWERCYMVDYKRFPPQRVTEKER